MEQLLDVRGISKRFGASRVLEEVSFSIRRGEVLGLIGPNGAGKTTLLECLAGLQSIEGGSVEGLPARPLFFIPDGITPWEAQPVEWVLRFFRDLHGGECSVESVVRDLSLEPLLGQRVGILSRGQRKRLLVALGLLTPHELLLLDEPFEGLDVRQIREMAEVLRRRAGEGRTLFLSIHQLHDAGRVCDRMVLLSGGRVLGAGTLDELRAQARLPAGTLEDVFLALT